MADYSAAYEGTGFEKGVHTNSPSVASLQRQVERLEKVVAKLIELVGKNNTPTRYRVEATRTVTYCTQASSEEEAVKWYHDTGHLTTPAIWGPINVTASRDEDLL